MSSTLILRDIAILVDVWYIVHLFCKYPYNIQERGNKLVLKVWFFQHCIVWAFSHWIFSPTHRYFSEKMAITDHIFTWGNFFYYWSPGGTRTGPKESLLCVRASVRPSIRLKPVYSVTVWQIFFFCKSIDINETKITTESFLFFFEFRPELV